MALLTATEIREHVDTDLGDDALGRVIDAADQEIIDRLGALATETDKLQLEGVERLPLSRKASSITSVVEKIDRVNRTLGSDDYVLVDEFTLLRLQGSTYPALVWMGSEQLVTYVPADETVARKKLLVDLVRLDCAYSALKSQGVGDMSVSHLDHLQERERLILGLRSRNRRMPIA